MATAFEQRPDDVEIAIRDAIWYLARINSIANKPMTSRILTLLIAVCMAQATLAQNATLITTFTNLTPATGEFFGRSVEAVGVDRVIIGASWDRTGVTAAGAAYLFSTNGTLMTTFANPSPADGDSFGISLAQVGSDKILIGASSDNTGAADAGAAYLFSTNGTLQTTFNNPTPAVGDEFGRSVSAMGADRVLIGAYSDNTGANNAGAVYLFSINGTLLTTITNPAPAIGDAFGFSVAAVGSDWVLVGAYQDDASANNAGVAYLFSTNGVLQTTFNNPTPAFEDYFGYAVAAVGHDRVLVGAYQDFTGAAAAGAAYLFDTNGNLLTTFNNPTPSSFDNFGSSVAAMGNDRVLICALNDDTAATDAGAAYLFSTNGTLLTTVTNPTPSSGDLFGIPVAVGSDLVLVGANRDDTGATDAGAAYLFALTPIPPSLTILPATPGNAAISWTPNTPGFVLQETEALSPANWTNSPSGAANPIDVPATSPGKYFRLIKP